MPSVPSATIHPKLETFARAVARTYSNTAWPEAEVYSVMADALRVASSVAREYTDTSCVELHQEELEAEGRRKLIELFQGRLAGDGRKERRPLLESISTRGDLFKMIATCLKNHSRGLVHKHRFTAKRTGQKVPAKDSPELADWRRNFQKPEISLDATPELRSHLEFKANPSADDTAGGRMTDEEEDDLSELCTPFEWACYQECVNPSETALWLAWFEAQRGRRVGGPTNVALRDEHRALALGVELVEYTEALRGVYVKLLAYRSDYHRPEMPTLPEATAQQRATLTSFERMVHQQVRSPSAATRALAAANRSPTPRMEHLAAGLGLSVATLHRLVLVIKTKLMDAPPAAISALETVFTVQVPRSLPSLIVRRLFTLAARADADKVTPEVAELLRQVGADIPQPGAADHFACFGVLYHRNHPVCSQCQARAACQVKAANVGLDQVTLRADALPAPARTLVRVPTVNVTPDRLPAASPTSEREEEIRVHLEHHFRREQHGQTFYAHKGPPARQIVEVESRSSASDCPAGLNPTFLLRVCNPGTELRAQLVPYGVRRYYVPDRLSAREVCALIDQHADWLYHQPPLVLPAIPDLQVEALEVVVRPVLETPSSRLEMLWMGAREAARSLWSRVAVA
jgi:hypothetical protein